MSRQRTDPEKIEMMIRYHAELIQLFKKGKLPGKITYLLEQKASELDISLSTYKHYPKDKTKSSVINSN